MNRREWFDAATLMFGYPGKSYGYGIMTQAVAYKPPVVHRIVNYQTRIIHSLQEACVIATCLRTMMPEQKVEIRELVYLTDFQVDCVEYRKEDQND